MSRFPLIFTVALSLVCQLSNGSAEPINIQNSNVWVSAPNTCKQNKDDNLVQCRSPSGQLMANFLFMIGFPDTAKDMALYTQNNLERMALLNAQSEKPFRDFKSRVSQRVKEALASGATLDDKVTYEFGKNEKGVHYVDATYTYANIHRIEIFSQLYEFWDQGKIVTIELNFPISKDQTMVDDNIKLTGQLIKSVEIR